MIICAFIAGALLFFAIREDIDSNLFKINRNILFPIFIIILIVFGVYAAQSIHLSETARRNSNTQQNVGVYGCFIENPTDCQNLVNTINNENYAKLQSGEISTANLYIAFSLQQSIARNILSYFASGILFVWVIFYFAGGKDER
jgi:hypothetical protein